MRRPARQPRRRVAPDPRGLDRSAWIATARPPASSISARVCSSDPTYRSSGASVRAVSATAAPSAASRWAIAFPSPRLAPVTSATLPSHLPLTGRGSPPPRAARRRRCTWRDRSSRSPGSGGSRAALPHSSTPRPRTPTPSMTAVQYEQSPL